MVLIKVIFTAMNFDVVIVGAGIVGLTTAYRLLQQQPDISIAIFDKEQAVAQHQTGHNSGVIHSGIYYKPGSLKAENCLRGYNMMLEFCKTYDIEHELCGKVIVATDEAEHERLLSILERGQANGLTDLALVDDKTLKELEPKVNGISGIHVPQTGIINYTAVSNKLAELIQQQGAKLFLGEAVVRLKTQDKITTVTSTKRQVQCKTLVNCAGLYSDKIALMEGPDPDIRIVPFRGEYYHLTKAAEPLVRNLIYPVPDPAFPFLGVHFTRMIEGGVEAGPNAVLAFKREGYTNTEFDVNELGETLAWPGFQKVAAKYWRTGMGELYRSFSKTAFTNALQKLIPEIQEQHLVKGNAGVRAQACDREGNLLDDFSIHETEQNIHVLNAPSPAATSSLSIGSTIAEKVINKLEY